MRNNLKQWLIAAFLITDGLGLAAFGCYRMNGLQELADRGVTTEGRVIDQATSQYSKRAPSYSLTVEFFATNSGLTSKVIDTDGRTYASAVKARTVSVRYLPDNPNVCSAGATAILPFQVLLTLGLGMLISGLVAIWFACKI